MDAPFGGEARGERGRSRLGSDANVTRMQPSLSEVRQVEAWAVSSPGPTERLDTRERAMSGGEALVVTIHAAALGDLDHVALLTRLDRPWLGAIHLETTMAAPAVVVIEVRSEDAAEVASVQDDDVVETLTANAADHALDVRRLPRAPRSDEHFLDLHRRYSSAKLGAVDSVSIAE